jgi:outer membrane receptor protein involved in Fe transport
VEKLHESWSHSLTRRHAVRALAGFLQANLVWQPGRIRFVGLRMWDGSAFAEDVWRLNSRLTLTYGLRYELQAPPVEVFNRYSNMNIVTGRFSTAGTPSENDCGPALICLDTTDEQRWR